ncbi:hypothetical protein [Tenacibaculum crassostreae]|uniref:hypothetical protein n=1 Tax=Tenacibaculum crassostreae TaxID=502683 RepID=UPI0038965F14
MKKSILNLGKALDKTQQKKINGGVGCDQFPRSLCFGPVPGCLSCEQLVNYPGAIGCVRIHSDCFDGQQLT